MLTTLGCAIKPGGRDGRPCQGLWSRVKCGMVAIEGRTEGRRTGQNVLEGEFDVAGVEGRGLDEREVVLACMMGGG